MPPDPSSCMVVLMHALYTMHLTVPNLMAMVLQCVVLETEMFTLNFFFCRLRHFYGLISLHGRLTYKH